MTKSDKEIHTMFDDLARARSPKPGRPRQAVRSTSPSHPQNTFRKKPLPKSLAKGSIIKPPRRNANQIQLPARRASRGIAGGPGRTARSISWPIIAIIILIGLATLIFSVVLLLDLI